MRVMEYPSYAGRGGPRLSWPAVFAGAFVTTAVAACLTLLGRGVGLVLLPMGGPTSGLMFAPGFGGLAWPYFSAGAAAFVGGWFTGRLSSGGHRADGVIYGFVTWAVCAAMSFALLSSNALNLGLTIHQAADLELFVLLAFSALASSLGGLSGARLYLPIPVDLYRQEHPEIPERGRGIRVAAPV